MLALIGTGLNDPQDITLKGLDLAKSADVIYLENYTSRLQCSLDELSALYGKEVIAVDRAFVEDGQEILEQAKTKTVVLLIIGDIFSATTHMALYLEAKQKNIETTLIHNASILTAVGITGLSLYKFGQTTSISFHASETPQRMIKENGKLHTLCLLDLHPGENKYMEASEAIEKIALDPEKKVVVCAQLGSDNPTIIYTEAKMVKPLGKFPQCLIIPGDLHFMEEEALARYKS